MHIARIKLSGYENVVVDCPLCNRELILNRVSDLNTLRPISGTRASCPRCGGEFWLNSDTSNERHEAIILDCHDLLRAKKYMNCILNVCQAYEMFFSLYLRVNLLYVPFGSERRKSGDSLDKLNYLFRNLSAVTEKLTFAPMRDVFLHLVINPNRSSNLDESEALINALPNYACPEEAELENWPDKQISGLLIRIRRTQIHKLRNKVVHKEGYRPMNSEAEGALREARAVLFPLTARLDLHDDINWYVQGEQ